MAIQNYTPAPSRVYAGQKIAPCTVGGVGAHEYLHVEYEASDILCIGSGSCLIVFAFPLLLFCQVLEFHDIDSPLSIGYMLALPTREAYDAFRRTIRYSSDDYGR